MKIILASNSPRRKELLKEIVTGFEIIPAVGEERADNSLSPTQTACRLAEAKCDEVFAQNPSAIVIGCDTVVAFGGEILGKPKDAECAKSTLRRLSGNTHLVVTGVCVRSPHCKKIACGETEVTFNNLSEEFIADYVAGGSPMDKAGSYGIQDGGVVKNYSGSYTNVVGLPVELVKKLLEEVLTYEQNCS